MGGVGRQRRARAAQMLGWSTWPPRPALRVRKTAEADGVEAQLGAFASAHDARKRGLRSQLCADL
eukprot:7265030-Pyramimonas_sp.AAC.1